MAKTLKEAMSLANNRSKEIFADKHQDFESNGIVVITGDEAELVGHDDD